MCEICLTCVTCQMSYILSKSVFEHVLQIRICEMKNDGFDGQKKKTFLKYCPRKEM